MHLCGIWSDVIGKLELSQTVYTVVHLRFTYLQIAWNKMCTFFILVWKWKQGGARFL